MIDYLPAKKGGIDWSRLGEFVSKGDIPFLLVARVLSSKSKHLFEAFVIETFYNSHSSTYA